MQTGSDHNLMAFVTMVRDEPFFLPRWIAHYAKLVPKAQLYILVDGFDQTLPDAALGCQIIALPRGVPGPGWDRKRWEMLADFAAGLLARFEVVVLNDVDELILADPASQTTLLAGLLRARDLGVISPFAVEMIHRMDLEPLPLDQSQPILGQRQFARINASYCKPCIISRAVRWTVGGHYATYPELHLDPHLYLFHLRFVDHAMLIARQATRQAVVGTAAQRQEDIAGSGWAKGRDEISEFLQSFQEKGAPIADDFRFEWQRSRIAAGWAFDSKDGFWRHAKLHNRRTYTVPRRFLGLI